MVSFALFMEKVYTYLSIVALAVCVGGCSSLRALLPKGEPEKGVDAEVLATYFDGPKVRPGVALAISVTASTNAFTSIWFSFLFSRI